MTSENLRSLQSRDEQGEQIGKVLLSLFLAALLLLVAPLSLVFKTQESTGDGDVLRQSTYLFLFSLVVLASIIFPHRNGGRALPISLLVTLLWCAASLVWAIEPFIGFRRFVLTFMIIWIVFKTVHLAGYEKSIEAVRAALITALVCNYIAVFLTPIGIHHAGESVDEAVIGTWKGLLIQKNYAGALCGITFLFFLFEARNLNKIVRVGVLIFSSIFLYKTMSKTAISIGLLSIFLGYAFQFYSLNARKVVYFFLFTFLLGAVTLYFSYSDQVLDYLTADDSLTGRGQIWPLVSQYAQDNWLLGSGFGSFWNIGSSSPIYAYAKTTSWVNKLGNGHNGFLDAFAQIGLPGFLLCMNAVLVAPLTAMLNKNVYPRQSRALLLSLLIFCLLNNLTETTLLDRDAIVQVFLMLTIALVHERARKT